MCKSECVRRFIKELRMELYKDLEKKCGRKWELVKRRGICI